jgi:hypothetical protein
MYEMKKQNHNRPVIISALKIPKKVGVYYKHESANEVDDYNMYVSVTVDCA